MKKIMTLVAILGFGMMVGCGPEVKPTTGHTGSTVTTPGTTAAHSTTTAPADTKK